MDASLNKINKYQFTLVILRLFVLLLVIIGSIVLIVYEIQPKELWVGILVWSIQMSVGTKVKTKIKPGNVSVSGHELVRMLSTTDATDDLDGKGI